MPAEVEGSLIKTKSFIDAESVLSTSTTIIKEGMASQAAAAADTFHESKSHIFRWFPMPFSLVDEPVIDLLLI